MKIPIAILIFSLVCSTLFGQKINGHVVYARLIDGDTVPYIKLKPALVLSPRVFKNERERRRYTRLMQYVKKVYPYAKLAEEKLAFYDAELAKTKTEKEKRQMMRIAEEDIKEEFYDDIRKLTFTQGRILLKLIDRQTDHTSYELLKEYRGTIRAIFWQGIARLFGANLKSEYDPSLDDKYIEEIVLMIEHGLI